MRLEAKADSNPWYQKTMVPSIDEEREEIRRQKEDPAQQFHHVKKQKEEASVPKTKTIEDLRRERMEREDIERQKAKNLMSGKRDYWRVEKTRGYSDQYYNKNMH
jgi:hypothetical protein